MFLLSSHPEPGSSWEGDQTLAEAAARPALRSVPGPYKARWDGRGLPAQWSQASQYPWVYVEEGVRLGCLVAQGGGWIKANQNILLC